MPSFNQLRDGTIRIITDQATYDMPSENFAADFGVAVPVLPDGINQRVYQPGARHSLSKDNDVVDGGPVPWPEGDDILARADAVMAAKEAKKTAYVTTLDMGGTINEILG